MRDVGHGLAAAMLVHVSRRGRSMWRCLCVCASHFRWNHSRWRCRDLEMNAARLSALTYALDYVIPLVVASSIVAKGA